MMDFLDVNLGRIANQIRAGLDDGTQCRERVRCDTGHHNEINLRAGGKIGSKLGKIAGNPTTAWLSGLRR
ncbi:hypothetical protein [Burkholderia sp. 22PA0106]|uniref:hypothetical protein n=1 Tax=Burkholderia sp. 22PA0106 TaxID=3237371 RepID=UPI0039C2F7B5